MIEESSEFFLKCRLPKHSGGACFFVISNDLTTKILLFKDSSGKRRYVSLGDYRTAHGITKKSKIVKISDEIVNIFRNYKDI